MISKVYVGRQVIYQREINRMAKRSDAKALVRCFLRESKACERLAASASRSFRGEDRKLVVGSWTEDAQFHRARAVALREAIKRLG